VKAVAALSVIGQLVGLGFAIYKAAGLGYLLGSGQGFQYDRDGLQLLVISRPTAITAVAITSITSLSGLVTAWAV
jgi:hypothetical protein